MWGRALPALMMREMAVKATEIVAYWEDTADAKQIDRAAELLEYYVAALHTATK